MLNILKTFFVSMYSSKQQFEPHVRLFSQFLSMTGLHIDMEVSIKDYPYLTRDAFQFIFFNSVSGKVAQVRSA